MNNKLQIRRALLLLGFLGLAFAGLSYRLVDLQILRHDELSAKAQRNTQREFSEAPRRGDILDANGNILATSVPVKTICADPSFIGNQPAAVAHVPGAFVAAQRSRARAETRAAPLRCQKQRRQIRHERAALCPAGQKCSRRNLAAHFGDDDEPHVRRE